MALVASTRFGPYEIVAALGAGGMGEVYRARDTRLDRDVAIKVLPDHLATDPNALARFHREARAVAALSHPNILAIYDVGNEHGSVYAVMELLEGKTLGQALRQGPIEWRKAVEFATAIANGMASAHGRGIIHRDLKPDNIFLTNDGGLKVLDFGLARLERGHISAEDVTRTDLDLGSVLGTLAYMSPEQARGWPADQRSDIFAFGSVLYEMVTARRPFAGQTSADTMAAILQGQPQALSQSGKHRPAELDRLTMRCLEKDPDLRCQSFTEIAAVLGSLGRSAFSGGAPEQEHKTRAEARAAPGAGAPSVAVLPFENLSSDPENEYFSDGLAEELINALTKVQGLRVVSRTSAFAFKKRNEDIRRIGEQLNVGAVLEGSVRKAGNRLRISAQLVNVADGFHLWSEVFNRELHDVFAIQDEIAHNIVKALRGILTDREKHAIEKAAPADIAAYDYYLRGRQFFHQFRRQGFEFARRMFERAIELDPTYARAHAGLADCYSLLFMYWDTSQRNLEQADGASQRALELDARLAEAHVARGLAISLKKCYAEAEREYQTAIALDPALFEGWYFFGRVYLSQGKLLEAAHIFEQACQIGPDDYQASSHLASIYSGLERKADAQAASQRCLQVVEQHLKLHPDDARATYLGAVCWCQLGESARGLEWATRALALDPEEPVTLYNVACVYALQGRVERALDCLDRSLKHGFAHREWIEHDADLNAVRADPRYAELIKRL